MRTDTPKTIYLKDYKPFNYAIESVYLNFDIHDGYTTVTARTKFRSKNGKSDNLFLNGEALELISVSVDGKIFDGFVKDETSLRIENAPAEFTLEVVTKIIPEQNTRLEGLYMSGGNYCTQCEAEGFRRITYFPDRPDVMTTYTVRVEADKKFPILLSNGNKTEDGKAGSARHYSIWHDPHPKPCYLFALVAGDLEHIHDTYTTKSGRKVDLYIYVRKGDEGQCGHAMQSLINSMDWDEKVYGLEYDLDIFNIVAVSDFNMGAMENKSLNIFNTALVLAHQDTATDADFMRVESVIAHEYFHNWSGNRVTCRDWFQLSLKEGLTVFRDQEFSADYHSRDVQRIDDVTHLRRFQFPEDSGPLSHPIRPDNYIEINNFYTMTVYEKGAEVIRMLRTILGEKNYRKGTDLYFSRHDGHAATCDDFVQCMQDASGIDLSQFRLWYSQSGTPELKFEGSYNESDKSYTVTLSQTLRDDQKPMLIPVSIGLMSKNGKDLIGTETLLLKENQQSFVLKDIQAAPIPSVLRDFSAPVKLKTQTTEHEYSFLMAHDTNGFNRWEAAQQYTMLTLSHLLNGNDNALARFVETFGKLIESSLDANADKALMARMLCLPDIDTIGQGYDVVDPVAINNAREKILAAIKREHKEQLEKLYRQNAPDLQFSASTQAMARRALRNATLSLLTATQGTGCAKLAKEHYMTANTMTDRVAALGCLTHNKNQERAEAFDDFYARFKNYPLVVDKWFALQACAARDGILNDLRDLRSHPEFNIKNPNRARSLFSAFANNNPVMFHAADGSGYKFLADAVYELNSINPQIAARLLTPLRSWKRYTPDRQEKMKAALEHVLSVPSIAPDVFEIASKSLKA